MILSLGRFLTAQELFRLIANSSPISRPVARSLAEIQRPTVNDDIFEDAVSYLALTEIIKEIDGEFIFSSKGKSIHRTGEASRLDVARAILQKLIVKEFPELIFLAYREPLDRNKEPDLDARSCLDECQLLGYELSGEAEQWWDDLRKLGVYRDDPTKAEIGRKSELRTVNFEVTRLSDAGANPISDEVHLVAKDNDIAGFDVLSMNFGWFPELSARKPLRIEVKTGRIESDNRHFSFVISSRELEIAELGSGLWILHVWFTGENHWAKRETPVAVSLDEVAAAAPKDTNSSAWQSTRLFFPYPD